MFPSFVLVLLQLALPAHGNADLKCDHETLSRLDQSMLRLKRNEVFARHGRQFKSVDLQQHFGAKAWYRPVGTYSDNLLTDLDRACVARVQVWENAKGTLFEAFEDLNGDGKPEPIYVLSSDDRLLTRAGEQCEPVCKARLIVGDLQIPIERNWHVKHYWSSLRDGGASFSVVDVNTSDNRKEILIQQHYPLHEDPGIETQFVSLIDGKLVRATVGSGDYNSGAIQLLGDGRFNHRVSFCPSEEAQYRLKDGVLTRLSSKAMPRPAHGCAACPYVDVLEGDSWVRQGEILRYQVGPTQDRWQRLGISTEASHTVHIRLSEEKDEVTHLDSVHLLVDEHPVLPVSCQQADSLPDYCEPDSVYEIMERGDIIELAFEVPPSSETFTLEAKGYYTH
jgi:hypothetical protein